MSHKPGKKFVQNRIAEFEGKLKYYKIYILKYENKLKKLKRDLQYDDKSFMGQHHQV